MSTPTPPPNPYQGVPNPYQGVPNPYQPGAPNPYQATQPADPYAAGAGFNPYGTATPTLPPPAPAKPSRKPAILAAVAVGAVAVLGGGGFVAFKKLSASGPQPDQVVPASAMAYVRVDVDPSAGQKLAALRILEKLPDMKAAATSADPREALWKKVTEKDPDLASVDFAKDIAPWLGNRAALAALDQLDAKKEPIGYIALAVNDEAKAREWVTGTLAKKKQANTEVTARSGFLLFTEKASTATVLAALDKGTLATNQTYLADMAALGEQGVASAWVDLSKVAEAIKASGKADNAEVLKDLQGRAAGAVRFDPSFVEVAGIIRGAKDVTTPTTSTAMSALPADTMAALTVNGAGEAFTKAWPELSKNLPSGTDDQLDELGVKLPDDLANLLGTSFTIAMPNQDLTKVRGSQLPKVGIKAVTKDGTRAKTVLDNLLTKGGADGMIVVKQEANTIYLGTDANLVDSLTGAGTLGQSEAFKQAVPNADKAQAAFYLDLDKIESMYLDEVKDTNAREALRAVRAIGMSSVVTGPGEASYTMRIVAN